MAAELPAMQTVAQRLASFQGEQQVAKRRTSNQRKKGQNTAAWPHQTPTPDDLARAGFFYNPAPGSIDNVKCFTCNAKLDGWEPSDNAIAEHLAHSSDCAWAISISVGEGEEHDPNEERMVEARKATYRDMWPYEGKKNWKCKTNKLVEAGWCYDPSAEAEDGVTCFYCNISLDGWEPKDNPMDEHKKRSPDCAFFTLCDKYAAMHPKKGKGRTSRGSKASRLSTQSMQSTFSEAPSLMSLGDAAPMDVDDSIATVGSTMSTTKGRKKGTKAATTKGRKKASKNSDMEDSMAVSTIEQSIQPDEPSIATLRAVERELLAPESEVEIKEEEESSSKPAKKTTRAKAKAKSAPKEEEDVSQDQSQLQSELMQSALEEQLKPAPRTRRGVKRGSDGLEKAEEASVMVATEAPVVKAKKTTTRAPRTKKGKAQSQDDSEMVGSQTVQEESSHIEAPPANPKRARKGKAQVEEQKAPEPEVEPEAEPDLEPEIEPVIEHMEPEVENHPEPVEFIEYTEAEEDSDANFVVHNATPEPEEFEPTPTPQKAPAAKNPSPQPPAESVHSTPSSIRSHQSSDAENHPPSSTNRALETGKAANNASTTGMKLGLSLATNAFSAGMQKTFMSPTKTTRIPLVATTPNRSPSKHSPTKLGRLVSSTPWTATDLETVFVASPEKENADAISVKERLLLIGGALSSPEKKMTVEGWIRWRAEKAEERLRGECERLVSVFEREGTRALGVLGGIGVE